MRSVLRAFLVCFLFGIVVSPGGANNQGKGNVDQSIPATFVQLPMAFEPNQGQADEKVRFISRGRGYTLFLTPEEAVLLLRERDASKARAGAVRMRFVGADPATTITGRQELRGRSNYLMGRDPANWRTNIPNFGRVHYRGLYPGVDATFYGNQGRLEYDFIVEPGIRPETIRLGFDGIQEIAVGTDGDLLLETAVGEVRLSKPILYQETAGGRNEIAGQYLLLENNEVGFTVGTYDADKPLVIDPQLLYATYLSGSTTEDGFAVAVDSAGDAYVTGQTFSANFPTSFGAFHTLPLGSGEVFVTKLRPTAADGQGSDLIYSTLISGSANDIARDIAVHNATGNACVVGDTLSRLSFPITANAFQNATVGAGDVFMTCLNSTGTALVYSTFLSGNNGSVGRGIAVDDSSGVYVTGRADSADFPTKNAFQSAHGGNTDVFVAKIDPTQSGAASLIYSTLLGGSSDENGEDVAVDSSGAAYVTGQTLSTNTTGTLFPIRGAAQSSPGANGSRDAFVAKIDPSLVGGPSLIYSTFLGGSGVENSTVEDGGIAVDSLGAAYVTGATVSADFPVTAGAYQSVAASLGDAFLVKLNPAGDLFLYSTYLGGSASDKGTAVAVDSSGRAYVTGYTGSADFPIADAFQVLNNGGQDAFVTQIDPSQSGNASLGYSTYLGGNSVDWGYGIAVDSSGAAHVAGTTAGNTFPATAGAFQTQTSGGRDAFLAKIGSSNRAPRATDDDYEVDEDNGLTIAAPGVLTNDTDDDGDPLTADLIDGATDGTLTLNSNGSFTYDPDPDFNGADTFTYVANDGTEASNVATVTITVRPVNDAPLGVDDAYTVNEDATLDVAPPGVLTNDTDADLDALTATLVTDVSNGTLTLIADGSFRYTPNADFNGADTFTYNANDPSGAAASATVTITVIAVNDPPNARDDSVTTPEDTPITITVLANDDDPDADQLTVTAVSDPSNGTVRIEPDGTLTFIPGVDVNGADTFTYDVDDGQGGRSTATVDITVTPVNDAPIAADDAYSVDEDDALVVQNVPGEDILENDSDVDGDALTAVLITDVSNGTLALAPNGSFTYTPNADFNGTDSFTYVANDGTEDSNVATVNITVDPVNDPPVGVDDAYAVDEDQVLTIAAPGLLDNDLDVDGDALASGLGANPGSGTLTLNGDGSFTYTPNADFNGTDTFQYLPRDGTVDGNLTTVTITVRPVNDAPVAAGVSYSTDEDTALTIAVPGVLGNDTDVDGDALTAVLSTDVSNGTLALAPDGSFTYTPNADFNGADSFTYVANDGTENSNVATVNITVNPVNDQPVATDDVYAVNEDTPLDIPAPGVLTNDSDPDGDAPSAALATDVSNGTLTLNLDGSFDYNPNPNFSGVDSFTYVAADGSLNSNPATVTITVTPVNDPPTTVDDTAVTGEDSPVNINVLANDSDPEGDPLTVTASDPPNGTTRVNPDLTVTYTPDPDFNGADSFTYDADDGNGGRSTGTVTITVDPVNDQPVAADDVYAVNEDTLLNIPSPGVLTNDSDPDGDALSAALATDVSNGTLTLNLDGSFDYNPNPNFSGVDSFTYVAADGSLNSNPATVTITVTPVNDPPIANPDSVTTEEDRPVTVDILANDSDPDGDPLGVDTCSDPVFGRVVINTTNNAVTYTPDPDFNGEDTCNCVVTDGRGGSATALVTFIVTPVNDAPFAVSDDYTAIEDTTLNVPASGVLTNDTDVDGDALTAVLATNAANGTVALAVDGSFTYKPDPNFNGFDSFTYTASDGTDNSGPVNVNIDVLATNDPPTANPDSATTEEDRPVTLDILANDSDPDGDPLGVDTCSDPVFGRVVINTTNNAVTYTPDPDFNGEDNTNCMINDGQGGSATALVTVIVTPVNDAPFAVSDDYTAIEDTTLNVPASGVLTNDTDVDGDALAAILVTDAANGTVALAADGSFTYMPDPNFNGFDSFTYTASDGTDNSGPVNVNIEILPTNDPPILNPDSATTEEDRPVTVDILANDSDPDGDPLDVDQCNNPPNGRIVINVDDSITYIPNPDFNGDDAADCMINDGQGGTATSRVTFTVRPVNDPPVGVDDSYTVDEDQVLTVLAPGVLANDTDVEGDPLKAILVTDVADGSLALNADGSFTYKPNSDFNGSDGFTYVPNDGTVDGNITAVTIRVNPVNDPPVATDDNASTSEDTSVTIDVLANDSDPDGDGLNITLVSNPANGDATIQGTGIAYSPDPDFNGPDTFSYTISDGQTLATATVDVDVTALNDAPVAAADAYSVNEDQILTIPAPGVLGNDSDVDGDALIAKLGPDPPPWIALNANGSFTYTPENNFNGVRTFTYVASDSTVDSNIATVTITVNPVNDPPIAGDDTATTTEGTSVVINVLGNDSDVDGDTLNVTAVTDPPSGDATINTDRTVTYNPDSGFTGTDAFSYTASDSTGLTATANVTVTVNTGGIEVSIDIRPGNPNNRINLQSNGLLPVAIFSTPEFDATTIDPATVTLAGAAIRVLRNGRHLVARVDRNRDGIRDLLAFFPISELELTVQDQTAVLRGRTVDGTRIRGEDSVQVSDRQVRLRNNVVWPSPLYSTLQDAVDAVRDGGTVRVLAGRHEINEPTILERDVTIRGGGCGECQKPRSAGRPRGRSTELVGPTPTTVVEADLAIGMFTYAGGGGGGGGYCRTRGRGWQDQRHRSAWLRRQHRQHHHEPPAIGRKRPDGGHNARHIVDGSSPAFRRSSDGERRSMEWHLPRRRRGV